MYISSCLSRTTYRKRTGVRTYFEVPNLVRGYLSFGVANMIEALSKDLLCDCRASVRGMTGDDKESRLEKDQEDEYPRKSNNY